MTDKEQIMINGVDVSECEYLTYELEEDGKYYWFCNIAPAGGPDECECNPECFYKRVLKQLTRKTQECEELIGENNRYRKALDEIEEYCYNQIALTGDLPFRTTEAISSTSPTKQRMVRMNKEELEQRLLTVFSQLKTGDYGIGLAIYYLAKVIEEKLGNTDELNEYPPEENTAMDYFPNIISVFCPEDRLDELDEVPTIDGNTDYWQVAKMLCKKDGGHLATREELAQLASNLYVDSNGNEVTIGATENKSNLKVKDEYKDNPPFSLGDSYWSSEEHGASYAYYRAFYTSGTYGDDYYWLTKGYSFNRAICIRDKVE